MESEHYKYVKYEQTAAGNKNMTDIMNEALEFFEELEAQGLRPLHYVERYHYFLCRKEDKVDPQVRKEDKKEVKAA